MMLYLKESGTKFAMEFNLQLSLPNLKPLVCIESCVAFKATPNNTISFVTISSVELSVKILSAQTHSWDTGSSKTQPSHFIDWILSCTRIQVSISQLISIGIHLSSPRICCEISCHCLLSSMYLHFIGNVFVFDESPLFIFVECESLL